MAWQTVGTCCVPEKGRPRQDGAPARVPGRESPGHPGRCTGGYIRFPTLPNTHVNREHIAQILLGGMSGL